MYLRIAITALVCVVSLGSGLAAAEKTGKISFRRTQLENKFRSEGVAVGDFNRDGRKDIAAGNVYFAAPDWKMHPILDNPKEYDPLQYSNSFCNWADDLNGDGWDDLIVVDFPGQQTWWLENPQSAAGPWKRHVLTPVTNNESPTYLDVDGDGRRDLVLGYSTDPANPDGPDRWMGLARRASDPSAAWALTAISAKGAPDTQKFTHGLGVGDINRDGRNDVVVKDGWWEAPSAHAASHEWQFHPASLGENCAQMHVYDFDGDGDNDVLTSSAPHDRHLVARADAGGLEHPYHRAQLLADPLPVPGRHQWRRPARLCHRQALVGARPEGRRESRRAGGRILV